MTVVTATNAGDKIATAPCAANSVVLGGGFSQSNGQSTVTSSRPSGTSWIVTAENSGFGTQSSITAYVICGTVPA